MGGINEELVSSLERAVAANPKETALRLHLADLLLQSGRAAEALGQINAALTHEPGNPGALVLLGRTAAALNPGVPEEAELPSPGNPQPGSSPAGGQEPAGRLGREPEPADPSAPGIEPDNRPARESALADPPAPGIEPDNRSARESEPVDPSVPGTEPPGEPADSSGPGIEPAGQLAPGTEPETLESHATEDSSTPSDSGTGFEDLPDGLPDERPGDQPGHPNNNHPGNNHPNNDHPHDEANAANAGFDWTLAEEDLGAEVPPPFVEHHLRLGEQDAPPVAPLEPAGPPVTLADVGGLHAVKQRLHESFLQPMKHAGIAKAFGKSLRGGLLLYGPPGCGKTFLARAVAGELGASFINVTMTDVLDSYVGRTEQNLHEVFMEARRKAPAVLFLDEVDALGMRRSSLSGSSAWLRQMVNQLLIEMDSTAGTNDGLYVLAATNHPWDLDEALLRPGRLDRMVLVIPPDPAARDAILRYHLANRPIAGIDIPAIVQRTDGFSGADLEHICVTAAEKAMTDSINAGELQPINMNHIQQALGEITASTGTWLEQSRNVVRFANRDGRYNDLADYLRARKML